jgi:hypothetical protein
MDCTSPSPTATLTGALSACEGQCALSILDCSNIPAWDMYDIDPCNIELALYGSNICEYVDISGFEIDYRVLLHDDDRLFGEDPNSNLSEPFRIKAMFDPTDESTMINAWGLNFDDTMNFLMIPITMFTRDATDTFNSTPELSGQAVVPKPGDVIYVIYNNRNYEVTNVGDGALFNAQKFSWELVCRPFRYSDQSDNHRSVFLKDVFDDPFETTVEISAGLSASQNNYTTVVYGDNEFIENESDEIDDYRDIIDDPDKGAFGY